MGRIMLPAPDVVQQTPDLLEMQIIRIGLGDSFKNNLSNRRIIQVDPGCSGIVGTMHGCRWTVTTDILADRHET